MAKAEQLLIAFCKTSPASHQNSNRTFPYIIKPLQHPLKTGATEAATAADDYLMVIHALPLSFPLPIYANTQSNPLIHDVLLVLPTQ